MAYINESVSEEEAREFELPPFRRKVTKREWTIDKEKDAILFKCGVDRDNPKEEYFYFYYKGKIVDMILDGSEYANPNTIKWKLVTISIPQGLRRDEVLKELRKAVQVYGFYGLTPSEIQRWKEKFNKDNPNGFAVADF